MKTLFLDLASHDALVALCDKESVLASESVHARIGDHELLPLIEKVCRFDELDRIACIIGPGGFTSLRIAVACCNVLADQLGIESVGVHLSELYRTRVRSDKQSNNQVTSAYWLHSTKKDQLFICSGEYEEPSLITSSDFLSLVSCHSLFPWCGELIEEHRSIVGSDPIALTSITEMLPMFLATQTYEKKLLTPWYGRGW